MPGISENQRQRLIARLRTVAEEHRRDGRPDVARDFQRLADNLAARRRPGHVMSMSDEKHVAAAGRKS
jgi:hypothetical protein